VTGIRLDDEAVQGLWLRYCKATAADPSSLGAVEQFGDSAEMADELLGLVLDGTKTATAGLARDYTAAGEAVPEVGSHWVVVDGRGTPRCVLKTVEIRFGALDSVDDTFAWDEGEGERTRDWWLGAHRRFLVRQGAREGLPFDEQNDLVVFERFEVVWTDQ
jgi:uncharacterized protein YhfF